MSGIQFIEYWINIMLNTIVKNNYGPTKTARFQYLVSTLIYYCMVTYGNLKNNCIDEPELKFIFTGERNIISIYQIMYQSMNKLFDDLNIIDKSNLIDNKYKIGIRGKKVVSYIYQFLNNRNIDGYKTASRPIPDNEFINKNKFIDVENGVNQDLKKELIDINKWAPLKHSNGIIQNYLTPYWGEIIPLKNIKIQNYIDIADENYEENNRKSEILEILKTYENLNDMQRMIAEYFQGGKVTPPGIWNIYALYTIKSTKINFNDAAKFLYLLNSTMFVGSIAAWAIKKKIYASKTHSMYKRFRFYRCN